MGPRRFSTAVSRSAAAAPPPSALELETSAIAKNIADTTDIPKFTDLRFIFIKVFFQILDLYRYSQRAVTRTSPKSCETSPSPTIEGRLDMS